MATQATSSAEEEALGSARRVDVPEGAVTQQQWATLEKLVSFVAHEIRNPLAALRATVELAVTTHDMERRAALLKKVIDSIDELSDFLTELLLLAGAKGAALMPLDLAPLVVGVLRLFSVQADVLNVRMTLQAPPSLPPVWGNAPLLRHVVMNLIKNSMEAMPDGGQLRVCLFSSPAHNSVCLAVEDTGHGIPPAFRDRLFWGTNREKHGHGVGLPFVHRVVTQIHRGRIWFDTEEGVGTTFYVELPAAGSAAGLTSLS